MRQMTEGRDYELRRDNDDPLNKAAWIVFIRGNGYDRLCGRFHNILKEGQNIKFEFEPTYIPSNLYTINTDKDEFHQVPHSEQILDPNDHKLKDILSAILYDILDRNRIEGSLIFTDARTGQNVNKALK